MNTGAWGRLEALFAAAVELPPAERERFLEASCAGSPEVRRELEALLAASDADLSGAIGGVVSGAAQQVIDVAAAGQRLGAYEVVRELGRGGMGTVFLGRRADREYEAEVAIKLIRGLYSEHQLRRFRTERQILARLRHPHIAQLLDSGTTPDGVPYVVMEHVDGVPLDRYCDEHRLSIDQRLQLFLKVCEAVEFAHRNLVVHCDLKPGNILVTPDGVPKLLDFGIARLLDSDTSGAHTLTAMRFGTPAYASPEQIDGAPVSVATDVHALGVILYELLTGELPYVAEGGSVHELERAILRGDPRPPAAAALRVGTGEPAQQRASARATDPRRLAQRLGGDLDAIALTALQPDPAKRYASVEALAQDLGRHRARLPVLARAGGRAYRASRFVRRHRYGVSVAAAALVLTTLFTSTLISQASRLARERDAARIARGSAEEVSSFLIDLFQLPDPAQARGNEITAREILDRGAGTLSEELREQPGTRAAMMDVIGRVYENLGLTAQATPLLDSALLLRRATFGPEHTEVAASLQSVAGLNLTLGRYDSARTLYEEALAMRRRLLPAGDPALAETLDGLASLESDAGNYAAAEPLFREALAIDRAAYGDDHPLVTSRLAALGALLRRMGNYDAAEPLLREALARRRKMYGTDHVEVGESLNQLARLLVLQGKAGEAEPLGREELAVHRKLFGDRSIEVAYSLGNLSGILNDLGRHKEALAARRESTEIVLELYGEEHPLSAAGLQSLANAHYLLGALDSARVDYERAVRLQRGLLDPDDPNRGFALTGLGRVLMELGSPGEAEPLLREALRVRKAGLPPDHPFIAATEGALGDCLVRLGRSGEAEPLLVHAATSLEAAFGPEDRRTVDARQRLTALHAASRPSTGATSAAPPR